MKPRTVGNGSYHPEVQKSSRARWEPQRSTQNDAEHTLFRCRRWEKPRLPATATTHNPATTQLFGGHSLLDDDRGRGPMGLCVTPSL